jgi:hypothetical protein
MYEADLAKQQEEIDIYKFENFTFNDIQNNAEEEESPEEFNYL